MLIRNTTWYFKQYHILRFMTLILSTHWTLPCVIEQDPGMKIFKFSPRERSLAPSSFTKNHKTRCIILSQSIRENFKPFKNTKLGPWKQTDLWSLGLLPGWTVDFSFKCCGRTAISIQSLAWFPKTDEHNEFCIKLKKFTRLTFSEK